MRWSTVFVLALAGSSIALNDPYLGQENSPDPTLGTNESTNKAKRFIVEFAKGADSSAVVKELAARPGTKVLKVFDSDIFSGASIEGRAENIDSLLAVEPVLKAWHSSKVQLSPTILHQSYSEDATPMNYSIHHMTGVDKLHDQGILGKGVVVAVVDTGVNYLHPALGGGFGPGFKVAGGYDLVGNGNWPESGDKTPDADPLDQTGHGTHVSGIIAGKDARFTGVAPDATLLMYKVFSQSGHTDEDTLIEAFLMAHDAGADIITSSIGGASGFVNNAWALVASRLVDEGVVVTISAGNDGQAGAFSASSGSSGENVLAIASIEADVVMAPAFLGTFNLDGFSNETYVAYEPAQNYYPSDWLPSTVKGWPINPLTLDTGVLNDACSPLPVGMPDLSNSIVLVRRGGCNFNVKKLNVKAFNASHLLFYNNEDPMAIPIQYSDAAPLIAIITAAAGKAIVETVIAGGNVTADFTQSPIKNIVGINNEINGGLPSSFTSIGPTNELFIKPDVAAPGGQIFAPYLGGWAVLSGTSMACPYVAGIAALYISKFGGRSTHGASFAKDLAMRIMSSGEAVPWDDGTGSNTDFGAWASVAQVGTGLVNATKVLTYDTSLSFSRFALNDTHHFSRYHSVDITNGGSKAVTYTFEVGDSGGMETNNIDTSYWGTPRLGWFEEIMPYPSKMVPKISFPGGTFTVKPGETKTAKFSFSAPVGLNSSKLPVYSGKVLVKGSNGDVLGVPYLGVGSDLAEDLRIMFQYPIGYPQLQSTRQKIDVKYKSNWTFDLSPDKLDYPNLYIRLNYATTELRWDIFESSWTERKWTYPPVVGQAGYVGSATSYADAFIGYYFNSTSDDANNLFSLPLLDMPRDISGQYGQDLWWLGRLANGTQIAPGKYKMRFAALVPFGDRTHADNWDVFPWSDFTVLPKT